MPCFRMIHFPIENDLERFNQPTRGFSHRDETALCSNITQNDQQNLPIQSVSATLGDFAATSNSLIK